jgi:hypothetical protein
MKPRQQRLRQLVCWLYGHEKGAVEWDYGAQPGEVMPWDGPPGLPPGPTRGIRRCRRCGETLETLTPQPSRDPTLLNR